MSIVHFANSVVAKTSQLVAAAWVRLRDRKLQLFLALLFAAWALFSWRQDIFYALTAKDGQIIVGSPTVYTRQRLVNDRLAQTAWLNDQLRVTPANDPQLPFQHRSSSVRPVSGASKLGVVFDADGSSQGNSIPRALMTSSVQKLEVDRSWIPTVDPTTSDLFRAKKTSSGRRFARR